MSKLITKIKLPNPARVELEYSEEVALPDNKKYEELSQYSSDEYRHIDFTDAAEKVKQCLIEHLGIPDKWEIEFKSIIIKRGKNGLDVQISIFLRFEKLKGGTSFTTPHLYESADGEYNQMPEGMHTAIITLLSEADAFRNDNKRGQGQLPFDEEEKEDKEESE